MFKFVSNVKTFDKFTKAVIYANFVIGLVIFVYELWQHNWLGAMGWGFALIALVAIFKDSINFAQLVEFMKDNDEITMQYVKNLESKVKTCSLPVIEEVVSLTANTIKEKVNNKNKKPIAAIEECRTNEIVITLDESAIQKVDSKNGFDIDVVFDDMLIKNTKTLVA